MKKSLLLILAATFSTISFSMNVPAPAVDLGNADGTCSVNLTSFHGFLENSRVNMNWTVVENKTLNLFEIEKSNDGKNFTTAALVFGTENSGNENYEFFQKLNNDFVYYRIKMTDTKGDVTYSSVLLFKNTIAAEPALKVLNIENNENLNLCFEASTTGIATMTVIDMYGQQIVNRKVRTDKGTNMIKVSLQSLKTGIYLIDLFDGNVHSTAKFIK